MASPPNTLYRNYDTTDATTNSNYRADSVLPSVEALGWEREGYTFMEWNTSRDGTGTSYSVGEYGNPLGGGYYAIWQANTPTYSEYIASSSDLTSVANAIRTKAGLSVTLEFPADFVSAIANIPTGITPTGTKNISISAAGTTTEDVTNYANAEVVVPYGILGVPSASKGTVSNHSVSVRPSVSVTGGWINTQQVSGTSVTVSASELVSGTKSITANGTGIDVTNYAAVDVSVSGGGFSIDEINNAVRSGTYATVRDDFVSGSVTITGTKIFPFLCAGAKNLTEIHGPNVTALFFVNAGGGNTSPAHFIDCSSLTVVDLPSLNEVGPSTFQRCNSLEHIYLPSVTKAGIDAFSNSSELLTIVLPGYNNSMDRVARSCAKLTSVDFGSPGSIAANTFNGDTVLATLIIRGTASVASLANISAFTNTPFASGGSGGTLYVPSALIASYQAATNWSTILGYANNQIKSIESTHTDPNAPVDLTLYYADGTLIPT